MPVKVCAIARFLPLPLLLLLPEKLTQSEEQQPVDEENRQAEADSKADSALVSKNGPAPKA